MRLARFLADVSRRNRLQIPTEIDPNGIILTRERFNPNTLQSPAGLGETTQDSRSLDSSIDPLTQ